MMSGARPPLAASPVPLNRGWRSTMQNGGNLNHTLTVEEAPELFSKDLVVAVATLSELLDERTRMKRALLRVKRALESFRSEATEEEVARIEAVVEDVAKRLDLHRGERHCG
jgi:predicted transcriptional regulator